MARLCPRCGEENPDRFRVCGMCGADLGAEARSAEQVRKTVTVVFSDLKGSTALGEALDSESLREVLDLYFRAMRAVLERHGGTVEKYIGDAVMAVFGLPTAHEDDALRAVRAAFEMREALARVNENLEAGWGVRLENRTGVNTGEVVAGDVRAGQRLVTGDTVNTAARLEQAAPPLEVLLGESTYRLVRDAVTVEPVEPLELKGKAGRVPAYRLLSVRSEQGRGRRLDAPLVGRERELQTLLGSLSAAVAEGRPHLVTVLGEAGVGKSRLLREFQARAGESVLWLRGRCLSYGEGITFWPLAEVVRAAADVSDEDPREQARAKVALLLGEGGREAADRLAAAIGLADGTYPVQETFWAARRFVELLARRKPVVLQLEDLHWAEPTFLDLVRFVADPATRAPAVLVCSSRRELLEDHPEWEEEGPAARCLTLGPLSREESQGVVENLLGPGLDERFRSRIVQAADGNPLFVEQLVSMLVDEGAIERDSAGGWVVRWDPETIAVPPTISALLTARLDRLAPAERTVVERAAVIGQVFPRDAVAELVPEETRPEVGAALATLVRKDLVRPHEAELAGHEAYRFVHVLVRDAAYHGLLKRTRAELHERFVDWVEGLPSDRVVEHEEIRGYHLEQAYLTRVQLGPADGHTLAVGRRGARYLASAGRRAVARGDMPAAGSLLRRAAALLPPGDAERPRLLTEAGEALVETGDLALAEACLETAAQEANALGDRGAEADALLEALYLRLYALEGTPAAREQVRERAEELLRELQGLDHDRGLAKAWVLLANVHVEACRYRAAEEALLRGVEHAERAGDAVGVVRLLPGRALCARYGPTPVPEAVEVCEEVLARVRGDRKAEALTLCTLAHLEAMAGRFERARELYPRARATLEEFGWRRYAALTALDSGPVELLAGDPVAAERELRAAHERLRSMGDTVFVSVTAALLAEALYRQGRLEEAEALTRVSEEQGAPDDVLVQALWRSVRAKVLARWGRQEEARRLGREAVERLAGTEDHATYGQVLLDLGEVLLHGGSPEAAEVLQEAVAALEAKGNVAAAGRARSLLAAVPTASGLAGDRT